MLVVSEASARSVVTMADAIVVVEQAFRDLARGEAQAFPVVLAHGSSRTNRFSLKSGVIGAQRLPGLKVGTYWPDNRAQGLKSHGSTTLLLDDATGRPQALVSASYLTALRTAAADAVAVKYLAHPDAEVLGIVGAGHQAWYELLAVCQVRAIRKVLIWSRNSQHAEDFARRVCEELALDATTPGLEAVVRGAQVLVTVTAACEPLVRRDWVQPGSHISAMGADASGKQELETELVAAGQLFADDVEQSVTIGEFEAAHNVGAIRRHRVRPLGSVALGRVSGRSGAMAITIFDSSGMAIQDLAIGVLAVERAVAAGLAQQVAFADE